MSGQTVSVDDNAGLMVYSGQWSSTSNAGAFNSTLHETTTVGASASMTFTGISVTIVGTIPPCTTDGATVIYEVVMDGVTVQAAGSFVCSTQTQTNVVFYSSETINDGSHQITITYEGGSLPLMLGQMETTAQSATSGSHSSTRLTSGVNTSSLSSTSLASSTTMTSSMIEGVASLTGVTTPGPTNASNSNSLSQTASSGSASHLVGPILGGILAAIIVILSLLFLLRYRRRRINSSLAISSIEGVTPFNLDERSFQEREDSSLSTRLSSIGPKQHFSSFSSAQMQSATSLVEKGYMLQDSPFPRTSPESAFTPEEDHASRIFGPHSQTQPPQRQSITLRPPTSISPSEAFQAHSRDTNGARYPGISTLTDPHASHILDGPPSYNDCCVRDADLRTRPELP